jgi:hypothetical protein
VTQGNRGLATQKAMAPLPGNVEIERQRAENSDVYIWLDPGVLAKLKGPRGPGESYSDVILRLATAQ